MAQTFHCTLVTPEKQVLSDEVTYASVPAWDGLMGIAYQRAPMVTKLGQGVLRLDFPQGGTRHFYISGGFVQVKDNDLSLLTTEALPAEQVVRHEIVEKLKAAQAMNADTTEQAEQKTNQINRNKAILAMLDEFDNKI